VSDRIRTQLQETGRATATGELIVDLLDDAKAIGLKDTEVFVYGSVVVVQRDQKDGGS
jgi:hypothetical protein